MGALGRHHSHDQVINGAPSSLLKLAVMPASIGTLAWVGPGVLWAALAQGSGELIWGPYFGASYGFTFIGTLLWASMLQWWYNLEIIRYEILTGENAMTGFIRIGTVNFTYLSATKAPASASAPAA